MVTPHLICEIFLIGLLESSYNCTGDLLLSIMVEFQDAHDESIEHDERNELFRNSIDDDVIPVPKLRTMLRRLLQNNFL